MPHMEKAELFASFTVMISTMSWRTPPIVIGERLSILLAKSCTSKLLVYSRARA